MSLRGVVVYVSPSADFSLDPILGDTKKQIVAILASHDAEIAKTVTKKTTHVLTVHGDKHPQVVKAASREVPVVSPSFFSDCISHKALQEDTPYRVLLENTPTQSTTPISVSKKRSRNQEISEDKPRKLLKLEATSFPLDDLIDDVKNYFLTTCLDWLTLILLSRVNKDWHGRVKKVLGSRDEWEINEEKIAGGIGALGSVTLYEYFKTSLPHLAIGLNSTDYLASAILHDQTDFIFNFMKLKVNRRGGYVEIANPDFAGAVKLDEVAENLGRSGSPITLMEFQRRGFSLELYLGPYLCGAARGGHLDLLKTYLLPAHDFKPGIVFQIFAYATENGHFTISDWLITESFVKLSESENYAYRKEGNAVLVDPFYVIEWYKSDAFIVPYLTFLMEKGVDLRNKRTIECAISPGKCICEVILDLEGRLGLISDPEFADSVARKLLSLASLNQFSAITTILTINPTLPINLKKFYQSIFEGSIEKLLTASPSELSPVYFKDNPVPRGTTFELMSFLQFLDRLRYPPPSNLYSREIFFEAPHPPPCLDEENIDNWIAVMDFMVDKGAIPDFYMIDSLISDWPDAKTLPDFLKKYKIHANIDKNEKKAIESIIRKSKKRQVSNKL